VRKIVVDHDDADDVLQNTFIKAWKALDNFKEESQLYTWLYRIGTNEALGFLRQKQRMNTTSIHPIEYQLSKSLESDVYFKGDTIQLKLQQAILTLPEKQRIVFNMRYYEEMPYEEMSEVLETSVGALKASYHHAAKKIEAFRVQSPNDRYPVSAAELQAADFKFAQDHYQLTNPSDGTPRNNIYYVITGALATDATYGKGYAIGTAAKNGTSFCIVNGKVLAASCNGADNTRLLIGTPVNTLTDTVWIATGYSSTSGWQSWTQ